VDAQCSAELRELVAGGAVHLSACPLQATTIDASNVKFGIAYNLGLWCSLPKKLLGPKLVGLG